MTTQQLTVDEKRQALRELLTKKVKNSHRIAELPKPKKKEIAPVPEEIPEQYYQFEKFPEYQALQQQFQMLNHANVFNPYFNINETITGDTTIINGKKLISYSSYNYLGFSGYEKVIARSKEAIELFGTSVSASRIATGEKPVHRQLEKSLADLLEVEDCIVYVSGHATNVTTIGHLFGPQDLIVHDSLIHNSILQGCILSGARRMIFGHNDWQELDKILSQNRGRHQKVLIAIEGVYSMDGDIAPLPEFIEIKKRHKTFLLVDEAHSMGVLGKQGRGIGEYFSIKFSDVDIWMGTLSKSFASCGGYIAGKKALVEYLKYTAPGFLYSVGISPANAGSALAAVELMLEENERVQKLQDNCRYFLEEAQEKGLDTGLSKDSAVVPVIVGNSMHSLLLACALFEKGVNVQPVLYPAVAEDASRLRFFITNEHSYQQIDYTLENTRKLLTQIRKEAL